MKTSDARAMTVDQIDDEVLKLKKEQFNLRFQRATGQLENTSRVRIVRRDIAVLKTIARQKRSGSEPEVKGAPAGADAPKKLRSRTSLRAKTPPSRSKPRLSSRAKAKHESSKAKAKARPLS